jgi:hypothetical protein
MSDKHRHQGSEPPKLTREQAADLLYRYPHVSDAEAKAILAFLRRGRHLDVGILTADEQLKPQLDSFMDDHAKHFRIGFGEGSAVVAAIAGFLTVCWLVWEAVKPATLTA